MTNVIYIYAEGGVCLMISQWAKSPKKSM